MADTARRRLLKALTAAGVCSATGRTAVSAPDTDSPLIAIHEVTDTLIDWSVYAEWRRRLRVRRACVVTPDVALIRSVLETAQPDSTLQLALPWSIRMSIRVVTRDERNSPRNFNFVGGRVDGAESSVFYLAHVGDQVSMSVSSWTRASTLRLNLRRLPDSLHYVLFEPIYKRQRID